MERDSKPSIGVASGQSSSSAGAPVASLADLLAALRDEFDQQADAPPTDDELRVLGRLVAAQLLIGRDVWPIADEGAEEQAIASFVAASLSRWSEGDDDYLDLPALVRAAFAQRGLRRPPALVLDTLSRVALGFLRRRGAPQPVSAQVAATEWLVTLYRAPGDDGG